MQKPHQPAFFFRSGYLNHLPLRQKESEMKEQTVYTGRIFSVVQKEMLFNGKPAERDVIVHPGGAAILAVHDGKVLMVRQNRAGSGKFMLEIPAGMIDAGEKPIETAMRELNEETGLQASGLKPLCSFYPTPGYDSEKIHIFRAFDVAPARKHLAMDADEEIELKWIKVDEALHMVRSGEIDDAKTIIALLMI